MENSIEEYVKISLDRYNEFLENNKRGAGNGASFYEDTTDYERKSSDNSGDF